MIVIITSKVILRTFFESVLCAKLPFIQVNVSTPESSLFDDKKKKRERHNPRVEFQQQEQTGISPGNTGQTKLKHTHP